LSDAVKRTLADHCAVIIIDAPPVNALSAAVRRGIYAAAAAFA